MKRPDDKILLVQAVALPQHDYKPALQNAVSWLGDRYLLAEPVSRRGGDNKPYFVETRSWHTAVRAAGPSGRKH
jgi:hypothetical protein